MTFYPDSSSWEIKKDRVTSRAEYSRGMSAEQARIRVTRPRVKSGFCPKLASFQDL